MSCRSGHGHGPAATEDWRQARHAAQEGYARDVVPSATRTTAHGARGARVLLKTYKIRLEETQLCGGVYIGRRYVRTVAGSQAQVRAAPHASTRRLPPAPRNHAM